MIFSEGDYLLLIIKNESKSHPKKFKTVLKNVNNKRIIKNRVYLI